MTELFQTRHIGTDADAQSVMLSALHYDSVDSLACAYAVTLAEAKRYREAAELLDNIEPRHPFDAELVSYARGVLYFRTKRWPDVLAQFPDASDRRKLLWDTPRKLFGFAS